MKKLTILVDMDDTIENLLDAWLNALNEKHGTRVTPDDVHSWDLHEAFPGLSAEQVYEPLFTQELWLDVRPKWDAVRFLYILQKEGHEIYIVTSSNFRTIDTKVSAILGRYFPFIPEDHVIVCSKKQMIRGDVMVDDAPHNLEGADYVKILMSAPHNRDYPAEEHGMLRVRNWREAFLFLYDLADDGLPEG